MDLGRFYIQVFSFNRAKIQIFTPPCALQNQIIKLQQNKYILAYCISERLYGLEVYKEN